MNKRIPCLAAIGFMLFCSRTWAELVVEITKGQALRQPKLPDALAETVHGHPPACWSHTKIVGCLQSQGNG